MNLKARVLGLVLVSVLSAPVLHAQISGLYTDGMGASKDPTQKAADVAHGGSQAVTFSCSSRLTRVSTETPRFLAFSARSFKR
jgi:hypothetical protein